LIIPTKPASPPPPPAPSSSNPPRQRPQPCSKVGQEVRVVRLHLASVLQEGPKNVNIHASSGVIRGIQVTTAADQFASRIATALNQAA
jgi:hypothetical protein